MYDKIDTYVFDKHIIDRVLETMTVNPAFEKRGDWREWKYCLKNGKKHAHSHGLTVLVKQKTVGDDIAPPVLHISGSIRKWKYGALSMNDLTRYDTLEVLTKLAEELGLTYDEFKEFPLSAVEVGLNLDLGKYSCEMFRSRICSFKDSRYKCTDIEGYKSFRAKRASGKVYDKVGETLKRISKMSDKLGKGRFLDQYWNKNELRVEYKANGGAKSIESFFGIRTVGDMVERYNWVALQWLKYALKFGFKSADLIPFNPKKRSAKEMTDYIKYRGLYDIDDVELQAMLLRLPAQARKDARDAIKRMRAKMPDAINVQQLFRQIARQQFAQQFNKSYGQFKQENSPTLLLGKNG